MKQRNHAFDFLCAICIFRMITLHVMQFCGKADEGWWTEIMSWSYFFMSFFFFKAGYFNKGTTSNSTAYLKDRARRLLVPYVCCGLIGNLVYFAFLPFLIARFNSPIEPLSWSHIWETSSYYGNQPVWFLFSFFCSYVVVHILDKVRFLPLIVVLFPFAGYFLFCNENPLWLGLNNVFMGVFFFYLGRLWHRAIACFSRRCVFVASLLMCLCFVFLHFMFPSAYVMSANRFTGSLWLLLPQTVFVLCGLSGFLLSVSFPRLPLVNFVGEHSMVYFISHYPMLYFYKFMHLSFGRSIYGRYDDVLILLPVIFGLCSWLVPFVERIPWLSGRYKIEETPQQTSSTE